uniref:CDP-diacylglycerol--glycerol-3-phosphate 3-phosphatidyltransferase n=1 Tax=Oryza punctata TaxID=4537 RepID=A0A0E0KC70_ORYPU
MLPSVATHASLLLKAAAAAAAAPAHAHLHPKPFFSPRAAQAQARIPSAPAQPAAGGSRYLPKTTAATATSATAACRWFRWPPPVRGLCSLPHSGGGGEGMGSEGVGRRRRVVAPAVNGVAKDGAPQPTPPKLLTLPTVLTIGRVAAVPLLISTFYMEGPRAATATTGIFLAAAVTDWLDGYIARKMQLGTPFGAFLDPVADKLMVAATLVLLCTKPLEISLLRDGPWLLTVPAIAIIGREAVAVNNLGKWKTATQMTALTILLASRDPSLPAQDALVTSGVALLYVSAGLAIWSLVKTVTVYEYKTMRFVCKCVTGVSIVSTFLHARLVAASITPSNFLASKLISLYSRAAHLRDARRVFDSIPQPSLFAWNAILIALSLHSPDPSAAVRLFASSAVSPDEITLSTLLRSLAASGSALSPLVTGELHAVAFLRGFGSDLFVSNALITAYANAGDMRSGRAVFDEMPRRDVVSWNSLISACARAGWYRECLDLFQEFVRVRSSDGDGVGPNGVTVTSVLHACAQLKAVDFGIGVHQLAVESGLDMDMAVWNSIVGFYAKCGRLQYARQLLDGMTRKDSISYSAMITGYMNNGHVEEGMQLFRQASARGISMWNSVIAGLVQNGRQSDVLVLLQEMIASKVLPNSATLSIVVHSVPSFSTLLGAKQAHGYAIRNDYDQSISLVSALIDAYAKAGFLDTARKVFKLTEHRSTIVWTSIISAVAAHGEAVEALSLFNQMITAGVKPDTVTFTAVLSACAHSGKVAKARKVFNTMQAVFGISPVIEQYACMVSALSRAGMLKEAVKLVNKMPFEPNAKVWGALLNGAAVVGDVEFGRYAFDRLFIIEPKNTGNYIVMANLYSNAGKWEEAETIRSMLWGVGLEKVPGCTWN